MKKNIFTVGSSIDCRVYGLFYFKLNSKIKKRNYLLQPTRFSSSDTWYHLMSPSPAFSAQVPPSPPKSHPSPTLRWD